MYGAAVSCVCHFVRSLEDNWRGVEWSGEERPHSRQKTGKGRKEGGERIEEGLMEFPVSCASRAGGRKGIHETCEMGTAAVAAVETRKGIKKACKQASRVIFGVGFVFAPLTWYTHPLTREMPWAVILQGEDISEDKETATAAPDNADKLESMQRAGGQIKQSLNKVCRRPWCHFLALDEKGQVVGPARSKLEQNWICMNQVGAQSGKTEKRRLP